MKYFYCPKCNNIYASKLDGELSSKDTRLSYEVKCSYTCNCGNQAVEIDENLIIPIQNINKTKFKTKNCCEGHLYTDSNGTRMFKHPYILFDESVTIDMFDEYPIPQGWTLSTVEIGDNSGLLKLEYADSCIELSDTEFEVAKKYYLMTLSKWIESLTKEESEINE